ncbi:MAG: hypothetical protein ACT4PU_08910 [Planctomycetota bacterium]
MQTGLQKWTSLLRAVALLGLVGLLGWGALSIRNVIQRGEQELAARAAQVVALERDLAQRDERIAELGRELDAARQRIQELESALRLLKVDHRVARLSVLEQRPAPERPGGMQTDVAFQELDSAGQPLGPEQRATLDGKVAYVDALVIKFGDEYVEQGDALRGSSVCLFRRLFGEFQWPSDGVPLDGDGQRPVPYGGETGDPGFESRLWQRFWDYANDPELAERAGVRALHGEAPYMELRAGRSYLLTLRASGGLSLVAE